MKLWGCFPLCLGISARGCILPFLQQGQSVMSIPVSFSIISLREWVMLSNGEGSLSNRRMKFKLAVRLLLAKKP